MLIPNIVMIEPVSTPAINVINSISSYVVLIHENGSRVDQWRNNEGHYVAGLIQVAMPYSRIKFIGI